MAFPRLRTLTPLALLLALPLAAQARQLHPQPGGQHPATTASEPDRPDLRRDWNLYWFGGQPSPAYLDYKNHLATREMRRWGNLMPKAGSSKPLPAIVGTAAAPSGTGGTWTCLGPTAQTTSTKFPDIDSGRPSAIAVDPGSNTLYIATSGGVFKCANADPNATTAWTWTPITDGLPNSGSSGNVSVGALALSPANPQVVYVGLGDAFDAQGRGFYVSPDGGNTWTEATGIGAQTISWSILPLDANHIFWGTNDGLKVSADGGKTFLPVAGGPASGTVFSIQAFSATELVCSVSDELNLEHYTNGRIYYSSDAGATWNPATLSGLGTMTPGRMTLAIVPSGSAGYAEVQDTTASKIGQGVLVTADKGHTWTWQAAATETGGLFQGIGGRMTGDGGQEWYNQAIAVDPANPQHVMMGANLAMYRSTNGGANWQQMTHWYADGHVYAHSDFHTTACKGGMIYVGDDGGLAIFKSPWGTIPTGATGSGGTPSDTSFLDNTRNGGLTTHMVYNVGSTLATNVPDGKYRISLGMQDNGTRIRQPNAGSTTLTGTETTFDDMIGGDGFATLINPADGKQMLGSLYYTDIYKSTDGGANFTESISGLTGAASSSSAPFQPRLAQGDSAHPNTVYTTTNYTVFQSTNFGSTWTALPTTGLPTTLAIRNVGAAFADPQALGVVTNGGRVCLSYNGGSSWTENTNVLPGNAYGNSYVWFDRVNSSIVYAASVALSATANHLWKSTDKGVTWTAIDGTGFPFGIPVHVVQTDPRDPNTVYAGTDFGVYYSIDGGSNWSRFGSGLPMVAVRDLYIAPDDSFIRAATFGRGVWQLQSAAGVTVTLDKATAQVPPSGTTTFTAAVMNFKTDNTVNWTVSTGGGSVAPTSTATGIATTYTAPATPGLYTVTAASNESPTATASATVAVFDPAALTVTVAPTTTILMTGASYTFAATVANAPDNTVTWSATGGTITPAGVYTAPATAGTYTITATSSWAKVSGSATVTVKTLDLNGDGTVDLQDLLYFSQFYGTRNATCDLNGDGVVDDKDLALLLGGL